MKCVIPGANVKILARAVHALAKIGDEMYVQPQQNSLSFRALNAANSAYADFTFSDQYFSYYICDDLEEDDALKCKISMRSAMTVFKMPNTIDKQVETCHIEMKANADVLFITLKYKNSIIKKHILPIIDCEKLDAAYVTDDAANQLSFKPTVLGEAIQNFQQNLVEITLEILSQKVLLRNYIDDTSNIANTTRTQLVLGRAEFDRYVVNTEATITFCLKELKAILNFSELTKVPLSIYFESAGKPIIFVLKHQTFEANLLLSTLNPDADNQTESTVVDKAVKPKQTRKTVQRSKRSSNKSVNRTNNVSLSEKMIKNNDRHEVLREDAKKEIVSNLNTQATKNLLSDAGTSNTEKKTVRNVFSNILKRRSNDGYTKDLDNVPRDENEAIPRSPSPPTKKARFVFTKCFETTFDPRMLPGHDTILAEDSDDDNE